MKKVITVGSALAAFALPLVSFAAVNNVSDLGTLIINIINQVLVPVIFAVAFIVFVWGAFQAFILGANDSSAKEKGKNLMIYGLIGFVVMVSVWGLVNLLTNTLNLGGTSSVTVPTSGVQVGS